MEEQDKIIHSFDESSSVKQSPSVSKNSMNSNGKAPVALFLVLAVLGIATGFVVSKVSGSGSVQVTGPDGKVTTTKASKGQTFGSKDEKTFKDNAEGVLREGGIEGEGAYHLERPGGESQNVYMTSSVIDLSGFIGKKVKVWGETNAAERAGWLMDVGRLQVL